MNATYFVENCFDITFETQESLFALNEKEFIFESFILDDVICAFKMYLYKKYHLNIVEWEVPNKSYPSYLLLGKDRGILAYLEFNYYENNTLFDASILSIPIDFLIKQIRIADSHLDRPIFYIKILNFLNIKGIYFETNEQIKDTLLKKESFKDIYYFSNFNELGDSINLISTFNEMKK